MKYPGQGKNDFVPFKKLFKSLYLNRNSMYNIFRQFPEAIV